MKTQTHANKNADKVYSVLTAKQVAMVQAIISTPESLFQRATALGKSAQLIVKDAAKAWRAEGLSKEEAGELLTTLVKLCKIKGANIRVLKSRALTNAGYKKDIPKCVARASRKVKTLTPLDHVLACARRHAKDNVGVINLLKSALIAAEKSK